MSRQGYLRLIRLLGARGGRKCLLHNQGISHAQLRFLEALRDCPVIKAVKRTRDMDDVTAMINEVHHLSPPLSYADIARSLRHVTPKFSRYDSVLSASGFHKWYGKQILKKHFPEPPWVSNDWLTPITSTPQLRQAG